MMTTTIGAEPFMKLLGELQHKYVEPLHAELNTFLASSAFAPVAELQNILIRTATHVEQEALVFEIEKEAIKLGAFRIGDVEVLVKDFVFNKIAAQVKITLQPVPGLLVQVLDFRKQESIQVMYSQQFEVPSEFHKLLRKRCFSFGKNSVKDGVQLNMFEARVRRALAKANMELFVYDRHAKLRALLAA